MRKLIAIILIVFVSPSAAQIPPKPVKTLHVAASPAPLYRIEDDGAVRIDWRRVEAIARSADLSDRDIARVLIAVRDGKAQAMQ